MKEKNKTNQATYKITGKRKEWIWIKQISPNFAKLS